MPENFEKECISLQNGKFSKPFETRFGWHIIKKEAQKEIPLLNKIHEQVEKEVIISDRGNVARREAINKLKNIINLLIFRLWQMFGIMLTAPFLKQSGLQMSILICRESCLSLIIELIFRKIL
ncbi:MAG: hypothetical protein HC831_20370 [Chloroflexia bacterium]|nr:hypothetical protein [Chloroflexia bacterium]